MERSDSAIYMKDVPTGYEVLMSLHCLKLVRKDLGQKHLTISFEMGNIICVLAKGVVTSWIVLYVLSVQKL